MQEDCVGVLGLVLLDVVAHARKPSGAVASGVLSRVAQAEVLVGRLDAAMLVIVSHETDLLGGCRLG